MLVLVAAIAALDAAAEGQPMVQPALSTLAQTVIGSLLVVSWAIAILALWQLVKVQNARVEDQKAIGDKHEALIEKMTSTFAGLQSALEGLRRSEETSQQIIQSMKSTFDLMVVMRQMGGMTPQPMKAVADPAKQRGEK